MDINVKPGQANSLIKVQYRLYTQRVQSDQEERERGPLEGTREKERKKEEKKGGKQGSGEKKEGQQGYGFRIVRWVGHWQPKLAGGSEGKAYRGQCSQILRNFALIQSLRMLDICFLSIKVIILSLTPLKGTIGFLQAWVNRLSSFSYKLYQIIAVTFRFVKKTW